MKVFTTSANISLLLAISSFAGVQAFAPSISNVKGCTVLFLLPTQGAQLAAAGSSLYDDMMVPTGKGGEDSDVPTAVEGVTVSSNTHANKARSFVSRVFTLPATLLHPKENEDDKDSVVVYPVVGFKFANGGSRALPTISNPSCRLPPSTKNEQLVGFYSPACHLDCDDDSKYTQMPDRSLLP